MNRSRALDVLAHIVYRVGEYEASERSKESNVRDTCNVRRGLPIDLHARVLQ